jgi:hypothetical protein
MSDETALKRYLCLGSSNLEFTPGSFRDAYKSVYKLGPFPVDRFNLLPGILPDAIPTVNIVPEPVYNLSNLTTDWKERYFSLFNDVATDIYNAAGSRNIVLMYSGGIDSTAVLVALMQHPRYDEFASQRRIKIAMSSHSIAEYPELFYQRILPELPIVVADFGILLNDPDAFIVTGDAGDYVIGNTDTPIFFHNGSTDNLHQDKSVLWPYLDRIDPNFTHFAQELAKLAPFDIVSVNQMFWWIGQAFVHQSEMCRPYMWSTATDLSELASFNKIFRFFLHPKFMTFSFEYMSTDPYCTNYNSVRQLPREYIVNYTKHQSYLNKIKVFSQKFLFKSTHKTRVYENLSWVNTLEKVTT